MTKPLGLGTLLLQHCLPLLCQDDYIMYLCTCVCACVNNSLDGDDTLRRRVSRPVNLHLSRRDVADRVDVAAAATNHTTDCVRRHQQSLRPTHPLSSLSITQTRKTLTTNGSHCNASSPEHWQQQLQTQVTYTAKSLSSHNAPCLLTCSCFFN